MKIKDKDEDAYLESNCRILADTFLFELSLMRGTLKENISYLEDANDKRLKVTKMGKILNRDIEEVKVIVDNFLKKIDRKVKKWKKLKYEINK